MNRTISLTKMYTGFRDDLFFCAYLFLFLNAMISTHLNLGDPISDGANYTAKAFYVLFLGVCALSLVLRGTYTTQELLAIGILLILGILSYYISNGHFFFDLTLIIAIAKGVDFEKFLKRALVLLILFAFVIICLAGLEIISSVVKERVDNTQMRNSLGFTHPNTIGLLVFEVIAGVIALERKRLKTVHLWLLLAVGVIFYLITRSQSCLLGTVLLVFAVLIYKWLQRKAFSPRQMQIFISVVLIIAAVVTILFIRYYWVRPEELGFQTLSGRITLAQKYLDAYGVNLFGHDILTGRDVALPGYAADYSYLDNGEIWYLVRLGIVGFVVFFFVYVRMIVQAIRQKEFVLCIIAAVYLIYSLTEGTALRIPFNFMIIYAAISLYGGNFLKQEEAKNRCGARLQYRAPHKELSGNDHEQSS